MIKRINEDSLGFIAGGLTTKVNPNQLSKKSTPTKIDTISGEAAAKGLNPQKTSKKPLNIDTN